MHAMSRTVLSTLVATTLALFAFASVPAHAAVPELGAKLDLVKGAKVKLDGTWRSIGSGFPVKLPGPVPPGLAGLEADARGLASATVALKAQAQKSGLGADVLAKIDGLRVRAMTVATQAATVLGNKVVTSVDVAGLKSAVGDVGDRLAAVLGLLEPVITR